MAELSNLKKGQTITEHIDTINENVNLINEEVEELKISKEGGVQEVNGKTGKVTLGATDVGAFPNSTSIQELDINNIKDTGVYIGTNANKPYYLIAIKYNSTNVYQELIGSNTKRFRRFTGAWSEWISAYSSENPITASDITGINTFDENKELEVALLNDGTFVKANLTLNPSTMTLKLGDTEIASKSYVDERLNSISSVIVNELPETGVANTIYFVPSGAGGDNEFNEWIWVNDTWEIIGGTSIDLTPFLPRDEASELYATKQENDAKVSKTTTINNKALSGNITLTAEDVGALPSNTKIETNAVAKYTNEEISTKLSNGEFVNGDTFVALDDGTYKKGHIYLYNNGLADITNFVDVATDQSIGGIKNFTGLLKYLGYEVATINDIPTLLSQLNDDATHRLVSDVEKNTWNSKSDFSGSYDDLTNKPTDDDLLDLVYPVGSIYMSLINTSPASFLGGTWEQIKDCFLWATGDIESITYTENGTSVTKSLTAGSTGGEITHTLTIDEMPSHRHEIYSAENGGNTTHIEGRSSTGNAAYTSNSKYAGGGQPFNNMPPYIAVYIWERIA